MANSKQDLMQLGQLLILGVGVGGFFVDIGKRSQLIDKTDKDLSELLRVIVDNLGNISSVDSYTKAEGKKLKKMVEGK